MLFWILQENTAFDTACLSSEYRFDLLAQTGYIKTLFLIVGLVGCRAFLSIKTYIPMKSLLLTWRLSAVYTTCNKKSQWSFNTKRLYVFLVGKLPLIPHYLLKFNRENYLWKTLSLLFLNVLQRLFSLFAYCLAHSATHLAI